MNIRELIQRKQQLQKSNILLNFYPEESLLEKAKKRPIGYINDYGEIKVMDTGDPKQDWKYIGKKGKDHPIVKELEAKGVEITSKETSQKGITFDHTPDNYAKYKAGDVVTHPVSQKLNIKVGPQKWVGYTDWVKSWSKQSLPADMIVNFSNLSTDIKKNAEEYFKAHIKSSTIEVEEVEVNKEENVGGVVGELRSIIKDQVVYREDVDYPTVRINDRWVVERVIGKYLDENEDKLTEDDIKEILTDKIVSTAFFHTLKELSYSKYKDSFQPKKLEYTDSIGSSHPIEVVSKAIVNGNTQTSLLPEKMQYADFSRLTTVQLRLLKSYTGDGFKAMNSHLLGKIEYENPFLEKVMNAALSEANEGLKRVENNEPEDNRIAFRTLNFKSGNPIQRTKEKFSQYMMSHGTEVAENILLSSSNSINDSHSVNDEDKGITYRIDNSKQLGKRVEDISSHGHERELLFPFDTRFYIKKVEVDKWWEGVSSEEYSRLQESGRKFQGKYHVTLTATKYLG